MGIVLASEDREPGAYPADFNLGPGYNGVLVAIDYTAEGGATATLDAKLQYFEPGEGDYNDIPGAVFTQLTGVSESHVVFAPGITAAAGPPITAVSVALPDRIRLLCTVGTDNLTFTASVTRLKS